MNKNVNAVFQRYEVAILTLRTKHDIENQNKSTKSTFRKYLTEFNRNGNSI